MRCYLHPALYYCCQTDRKRARVQNVNTIGAVECHVIYEHQEAVRIWHSFSDHSSDQKYVLIH